VARSTWYLCALSALVAVVVLAVPAATGAAVRQGSACVARHVAYVEGKIEVHYRPGCTGHDEPELDPVSSAPGSAQDLAWRFVLPSAGAFPVSATGPTFWFGGTVTDPNSFLGQAFVQSGLGKWRNLDGVTTFFDQLGIPAPHANAVFIATLELVGGACLGEQIVQRNAAFAFTCPHFSHRNQARQISIGVAVNGIGEDVGRAIAKHQTRAHQQTRQRGVTLTCDLLQRVVGPHNARQRIAVGNPDRRVTVIHRGFDQLIRMRCAAQE